MTGDPLDVWCPICQAGPAERCRSVLIGLDPMRTLVHRARAVDAAPAPAGVCQNCGNEDADEVLALCRPCAESIPDVAT
jgi:hypothetical protein